MNVTVNVKKKIVFQSSRRSNMSFHSIIVKIQRVSNFYKTTTEIKTDFERLKTFSQWSNALFVHGTTSNLSTVPSWLESMVIPRSAIVFIVMLCSLVVIRQISKIFIYYFISLLFMCALFFLNLWLLSIFWFCTFDTSMHSKQYE